jgi:hypothetical protein
MRKVTFDVPVEVLTEFLEAVSDKELNSTVVSKTDNEFNIEIDYDREESGIIDELEETLETLIEGIEEEEAE